jgi:alpha-glucosidase
MYFHMFDKAQPDINWRNPSVRQSMLDVFRFWLDRGADGFRLDVFNAFYKHPELKDNPRKLVGLRGFERMEHINDIDQPDMIPLLNEIRAILDGVPNAYAVGETFLGGAEKAAKYCGENLLHGTFNFEFAQCSWWARAFLQSIQRWDAALSPDAWPTYFLNNHDLSRSATRYARGEDDSRLKAAAAMLLTLRGTPFLYYGEEIGMRDIPLTREIVQDPVGKRYWPLVKGRDGCRAPMQWADFPNAGFSPAHAVPWLPLHADYRARNVAAQQSDPDSLLTFYRKLIALRKANPALRSGMFTPITYGTHFLLAYLRQLPEETVLVAINFSNRRQRLVLGRNLADSRWELLLSSKRASMVPVQSDVLPLEPNEAIILKQYP